MYCKQGKIRWAKLLQTQPNELFRRNIFVVPWPQVLIKQRCLYCGTYFIMSSMSLGSCIMASINIKQFGSQ